MSDLIRVSITGPHIKACYLATSYRLDVASDGQLVVLSVFTTDGIYNYKVGTVTATKCVVRVQAINGTMADAFRMSCVLASQEPEEEEEPVAPPAE